MSTALAQVPAARFKWQDSVRCVRGAERELIRASVRGRIDDVVVEGQREQVVDALVDVASEHGTVLRCAADSLASVAALTRDLRASRVSLVVVSGASEVSSLVALSNVAHRYGARVAVDATEIVARQPFSIVSHGFDYMVADLDAIDRDDSDFGTAATVLIGRPDWFADIEGELR